MFSSTRLRTGVAAALLGVLVAGALLGVGAIDASQPAAQISGAIPEASVSPDDVEANASGSQGANETVRSDGGAAADAGEGPSGDGAGRSGGANDDADSDGADGNSAGSGGIDATGGQSNSESSGSSSTGDGDFPPDSQHGFTNTDIAVLFSRDADTGETDGDSLAELANATDLSFSEPPATARNWTRQDFVDLNARAGGSLDLRDHETSYYPDSASPTSKDATFDFGDGGFFTRGPATHTVLRDAHVTMFAMQPSTIMHEDAGEPTVYVRHEGESSALVDYRVETPDGQDPSLPGGDEEAEVTKIFWEYESSEIENTTMYVNTTTGDMVMDEKVSAYNHTPIFGYEELYGNRKIEFRTNVTVTFERTVERHWRDCDWVIIDDGDGESDDGDDGSDEIEWEKQCDEYSESETREVTATMEVRSDETEVRGLYPSAAPYNGTYPDGDYATAMYEPNPWTSVEFPNEGITVTGVWRYYTARDTSWDELTIGRESGDTTQTSVSLPVFVHGYPSANNVSVKPTGNATQVVRVWGPTRESPEGTLGSNIRVSVVDGTYTKSSGMALRAIGVERDLQVNSIFADTTADVVNLTEQTKDIDSIETVDTTRTIRESNMTVKIIDKNTTGTKLQIELVDNVTKTRIDLDETVEPLGEPKTERPGYVTVNGERIEMDATDATIVALNETGTFTVRYHPASWVVAEPAYTPAEKSVKHQPLDSGMDVLRVLNEIAIYMAPVVVVLLMARRLRKALRRKRR